MVGAIGATTSFLGILGKFDAKSNRRECKYDVQAFGEVIPERQAAGEPFALETCYLSAAQFSGLLSAQLQKASLFSTLERDYGVELGYSDEEVDATMPDPRTAELLGVSKREPLLRIRQVIYSTKGVVILYVLGLYRSDRHNLVIRRYR